MQQITSDSVERIVSFAKAPEPISLTLTHLAIDSMVTNLVLTGGSFSAAVTLCPDFTFCSISRVGDDGEEIPGSKTAHLKLDYSSVRTVTQSCFIASPRPVENAEDPDPTPSQVTYFDPKSFSPLDSFDLISPRVAGPAATADMEYLPPDWIYERFCPAEYVKSTAPVPEETLSLLRDMERIIPEILVASRKIRENVSYGDPIAVGEIYTIE